LERVYYSGLESPIGTFWAAATERGLFHVEFPRPEVEFLGSLKRRIDVEAVHDPGKLSVLRGMLEAYFNGEHVAFKLPLDLRGTDFQKAVWRATYGIPYGRLSSYGRLAAAVGKPRAARAVGNAMGANQLVIVVPCHRVVRSDGSLGGFGDRPELKRYLLSVEGVLPRVGGVETEYPIRRGDLLRHFRE
jgi:O-6-methylguanine DNA methyltransferase